MIKNAMRHASQVTTKRTEFNKNLFGTVHSI